MATSQSFYQHLKSSITASAPGRAFVKGTRQALGLELFKGGFSGGAKGFLGRAFIPAFTGMSAYKGYKEGGIFGAAKGAATSALEWGAIDAAVSVATNPYVMGAAAVAGAGYGYYKLGEAAKRHERGVKNLEMGTEVVDRFGTISTMRQRSLQAIQNSHLNARGALGNEALLLSTPYLR